MTFETACFVVANQNAQMEVSEPPGGRGCKKAAESCKTGHIHVAQHM